MNMRKVVSRYKLATCKFIVSARESYYAGKMHHMSSVEAAEYNACKERVDAGERIVMKCITCGANVIRDSATKNVPGVGIVKLDACEACHKIQ